MVCFIKSALLLAVGTCAVLSFEAMPGLCCFLRVTQLTDQAPSTIERAARESRRITQISTAAVHAFSNRVERGCKASNKCIRHMHIGHVTPSSLRQRIKRAQLKRIRIELMVGTRVGRDRLQ